MSHINAYKNILPHFGCGKSGRKWWLILAVMVVNLYGFTEQSHPEYSFFSYAHSCDSFLAEYAQMKTDYSFLL